VAKPRDLDLAHAADVWSLVMNAARKGKRAKPAKPAPPISLRAYARHRKEPSSPAERSTQCRRQSRAGGSRSRSRPTERSPLPLLPMPSGRRRRMSIAFRSPGRRPPGHRRPTSRESRARREAAEAALAEIELAEKRRELVLAKDVESRLVNVFAQCKTKLLGVPARCRQRDPGLTGPQIELIESLVREACDDLANKSETG
jgi:hypothetical protein